jgi:hypothetical protein
MALPTPDTPLKRVGRMGRFFPYPTDLPSGERALLVFLTLKIGFRLKMRFPTPHPQLGYNPHTTNCPYQVTTLDRG